MLHKTNFRNLIWAGFIFILARCRPAPAATPDPTLTGATAAPQTEAAAITPASSSTPAGAAALPAADPSLALLPEAQADLSALQDLPRYTLSLALDYPARSFQGHARLEYTNVEEDLLDELYLRLFPNGQASYGNGSLTVEQVQLDGKPVASALSEQDTVVKVPLVRSLRPGQKVQLDFDFSGVVPEDFGGTSGYGIYNFSQGVLALSGWFPILAVYDDQGWHLNPVSPIGDSVYSEIGFYTVEVTTGSDLVLAATGVEVERQSLGDATRYRFAGGPVRDFFLIASPDFQVNSQTVGGVRVNSYYLPDDQAGGAEAASVAADSLQVYSHRFGPYPYRELDVVEAPMNNASGVEYPGIVLISDHLYPQSGEIDFSMTVAHEVGHQWWYNLVGNDVFAEPWLDEALTSYTAAIYEQEIRGDPTYDKVINYWQQRYQQLAEKGGDDLVTRPVEYFQKQADPRIYSGVVYVKGALFFEAARQEIGDEAFFQALQEYFTGHKYGLATAGDLLAAFEQAAGRSLESLYRRWLYAVQS